MSEEALQSAIKNIQDVLSKHVKKPPLSEKFLKKPPFRYLHDIINAVIRETGFLEGVFTAEELDSNNVKDKESKIAFLSKLISAVKTASGKSITARPGKIAAGLEVEKTLELLQIIGQTVDNKKPSLPEAGRPPPVSTKTPKETADAKPLGKIPNENQREITEKVTASDKTPAEPKSKKHGTGAGEKTEHGRRTSVSKRESVNNEQRSTASNRLKKESKISNDAIKASKESKFTNDATKANKESKDVNGTTSASNETKAGGGGTKGSRENIVSSRRPSNVPTRKSSLKDSNRKVIDKKLQSVVIKEEREEEPIPLASDEQAAKSKKIETKEINGSHSSEMKKEDDEPVLTKPPSKQEQTPVANTDMTEKSNESKGETNKAKSATTQRPGSARPGSRKSSQETIKTNDNTDNGPMIDNSSTNNAEKLKNQTPIRPRTATRPPSARPGAPKIRDRGEVSVPEETTTVAAPVNVFEEGTQDNFADDKDDLIVIEPEQPSLAQEEHVQINDTEQGQLVHQILKTQKELNDSVVDVSQNRHLEIEWEAGRQREKDVVTKEVEEIRNVIQTLTSAANPLGKLFDFLQEDVDEMQRELQHWKNTSEKFEKQQEAESELKNQLLQPLRKQLQDVEASIEDEYRQISSLKMSLLTNDEKIMKIISGPAPPLHPTKTRVK